MKSPKPKVLFYDIETSLLLLHGFALGKQVVRHDQLLRGYFSHSHIICISYKWDHEKEIKTLTWGESLEDERKMIQAFDKLIQEADVVIGKNNNRFDDKHLNTQRLWHDLPGMSDWTKYTDDLEKQMRKHFYLPSYSLDYLSEQLNMGGKHKMGLNDWHAINAYRTLQMNGITKKNKDTIGMAKTRSVIEFLYCTKLEKIIKDGEAALKKMFDYNKKDVADTSNLWKRCVKHFEPRLNQATWQGREVCKTCGSKDIVKNGVRTSGQKKYQIFHCNNHGGFAGRAVILANGEIGKIS